MTLAAYIQGNLAVERKLPNPQKPERDPRKKIYRPKGLSVRDKLFYLFTVVICVAVACVIVWRYAHIYKMNSEIHQIQKQISRMEASNNELNRQISKLQSYDRLLTEAKRLGMVPVDDKQISRIEPTAGGKKPDSAR